MADLEPFDDGDDDDDDDDDDNGDDDDYYYYYYYCDVNGFYPKVLLIVPPPRSQFEDTWSSTRVRNKGYWGAHSGNTFSRAETLKPIFHDSRGPLRSPNL